MGGFSSQETPPSFEPPAREVMPPLAEPPAFPTDTPVPMPRPVVHEAKPAAEGYQDLLAQVVRSTRQRTGDLPVGDEVARARLRPTIEQVARSLGALPPAVTPERLTRDALAELAGMGAFESILEDPENTSAVIDATGHVALGRGGAAAPSPLCFSSGAAVVECLDRLLRAHGVSGGDDPFLRATLADGATITVARAPLVARGVAVVIERASPRLSSLAELSSHGALSASAAQLLGQAVASRRNIAVVGPCAASREAVLGALLAAVPAGERVTAISAPDGIGSGRRDVLSLRGDGRWDDAIAIARAARAPRCFLGETNGPSARAFVGELVTGAEAWVLGVDAPTGPLGLARIAALAAQDPWLTRADAGARLQAGRVVVVETARAADGALRVLSVGEARADGSVARLDG